MSSPLSLYRLQQVDSAIDRIRVRLDTIQQILENDEEIQQANALLAKAESSHADSNKVLHQIEAKAESLRIKIEQSEASLYGGTVQNPKELQDLQNEVAALNRHLATLEDRLLEAMLDSDATKLDLQEAQSASQDVWARLSKQNQNLTEEQVTMKRDLERLDAERQAITGTLETESLNLYERLRHQRRGVAVSTVSDDNCSACGSNLTPSQQQTARSVSKITHCPSCGRILYAG